jgi:hypothetical protein
MFITATEIRFRSPWAYLRFLVRVAAVKRQVTAAPGLLRFSFTWNRTLSAWESPAPRRRFRNSGEHLEAMRATPGIGWAKSVSWEGDDFPSWREAARRLRDTPYPQARPRGRR